MYRYHIDSAVTYTPDDLALFRESPFALWMERLTLENPDHGIPPDVDSHEPHTSTERQDEIVDTLRAEGRNVALIDWDTDESDQRTATLAAMRDGADFIVNGVLAIGVLSGTANLLMRTSGYSELGDFLYVPCDTQAQGTFEAAFRLCFLADVLQDLQGQLPPQMLLIRGDADVLPLQTEDHIYYYRAVKKRAMEAAESFRKHRMPDPSESAHFGRWSECASEVLKQRALSEEAQEQQLSESGLDVEENAEQKSEQELTAEAAKPAIEEQQVSRTLTSGLVSEAALAATLATELAPELVDEFAAELAEEAEHVVELQKLQVAGMSGASHTAYDAGVSDSAAIDAAVAALAAAEGPTLAEQASRIEPDTFNAASAPGRTPNLAQFPRGVPSSKGLSEAELRRRESDIALQNLEFIGSGPEIPFEVATTPQEPCDGLKVPEIPPPNLRQIQVEESAGPSDTAKDRRKESRLTSLPDIDPPEPALLPPELAAAEPNVSEPDAGESDAPSDRRKPHPLDSDGFTMDIAAASPVHESAVDLDSAPSPELTPVFGSQMGAATASAGASASAKSDPNETLSSRYGKSTKGLSQEPPWAPSRTFSDSLITSERLDDY